ncbi:agmatine deiminase [Nesterenkonia sp. AN1]|uniref:Agmatine deiminase n=1 Tax=Nesterenkonia aurantiaca TaxID=1436010 RepID=A0A4V3ECH4_9MICC|nr:MULTISPECIES: agmatine deiminase family protein [Nesterenkonia]EXF24207.1 agmatine deiminase [Nesterenkonia sp. AN1]TDS86484.1 agmatine deiminase [Nesterenkonia aurantiaca]
MTSSPHLDLRMPPEWAPHERTWMAFPCANATFGAPGSATLDAARAAWVRVAKLIAEHEPVTVVVAPMDLTVAQELLGDTVTLRPLPLDDAWMRDIGPTFVHRSDGELAAVDWVFNGWGAQSWASWNKDEHIAAAVTAATGAVRVTSRLINEGGAFHVDGRGTVLLTETVQRDLGRNPGMSHAQIEAELHSALGTTHAVWFPRGLTRDYAEFGTRGHVDMFAAFTPSGSILLHRQDNPAHPDHAVTRELRGFLETARDAAGEPFDIIDVPAPATILADGEHVDWTYINHYVANGVVLLCAYDDPADEEAAAILAKAYPDRRIELLDARDILRFGGGIHCITQQQPAAVNPAAPLDLLPGDPDR